MDLNVWVRDGGPLYYRDDWVTLYCGDCMEIMPYLDSVDLVLTDPPYGVNADKGVGGYGASDFGKVHTAKKYSDDWDSQPPSKEAFNEILRISKHAIIFGGNFFTDKLPVGTHWIVWDKVGDIKFDNPYGDCELAWTNFSKESITKYRWIQQGFIADAEETRKHPTQKPEGLIKMILKDYGGGDGNIILDPFLGSGTTCVVAKELKLKSIGIEIDPKYCEVSFNRVYRMYQGDASHAILNGEPVKKIGVFS